MSVHIPPAARLSTREVSIGSLKLGAGHPIRIQTMTTTDTMDTAATVAQTIRCIEAGAELVRITAPSKKEAENLAEIKNAVRAAGYDTPLVADIHFTPNAAELAARIVEKVRINPGNYVDKKKFEQIDYTDAEYAEEIDRIRERFTPLVRICKEHGTAMRIGTNHGSLSDRIMSRYGDTALGMVESAMEFLRIARDEDYHQIVLSMKSSNPLVMVDAYRTLVRHMLDEFGECYPLHLGVTEAGDGEDGRIKSAIGIGTLLQEGIGDTIRVSLTEEPEYELPVCRDLVEKVGTLERSAVVRVLPNHKDSGECVVLEDTNHGGRAGALAAAKSRAVGNIGGAHVPVVVADFMHAAEIRPEDLRSIGYTYDAALDKWHLADGAADYLYAGSKTLDFEWPGTLRVVVDAPVYEGLPNRQGYVPLYPLQDIHPDDDIDTTGPLFIGVALSEDFFEQESNVQKLLAAAARPTAILCAYADAARPAPLIKALATLLLQHDLNPPVIIGDISMADTVDKQLIDFSMTSGSLFLEGIGHGIWLMNDPERLKNDRVSGRTYLEVRDNHQFLNNTAFSILQATRKRISKTEYISCPSCGRTLFDLQETTAKIRAATHHLKGVKIAIMGCIVNGPGEMADADFGYVGSGPGKITLYKSKEVVKRNVPSEVAVDELIELLKENGAWVERG